VVHRRMYPRIKGEIAKTVANRLQCITIGALFNQSLFLILIGIMKGKTAPMIANDFENVSV
jgi:hypothetical protein